MADRVCGECKHWHPKVVQGKKLAIGVCDGVEIGTIYDGTHSFVGTTFRDESYDEALKCFERK